MRRKSIITLLLAATGCAVGAMAQVTGTLEANKLAGRTETFYVNSLGIDGTGQNNQRVESLGVAIASNGNVIIGWEDDHPSGSGELGYFGSVWTLYSPGGLSITPVTKISSLRGGWIDSKFLSYFRADGSAIPANTAWGPKIKGNLFGTGMGMGASAWALDLEVVELAPYNNTGDMPAVQLLSDTGAPVGIRVGIPVDYAARSGSIRIGDWDYLSNGNIVIVGESRQRDDLINLYGGTASATHAVFTILDPTGAVVKPVTLVSEVPVQSEMWHGVGVTANGFGIRFGGPGGATVRLFDNAGAPTTGNLDLGTLTGNAQAATGGRGDGAGFHGNGKDAYVATSVSGTQVWLTVLNANGTVRYSKAANDDVTWDSVDGRCDAAIDAQGRVFSVWSAAPSGGAGPRVICGRMFDPAGAPIGGSFYVSELDTERDWAFYESRRPRIATRGDAFAVIWESQNDINSLGIRVVTGRFFGILFEPGSIESVGLQRIVPDTPIINQDMPALGNWEPYASVLGTSTFLVEGNAFAEPIGAEQRFVVALQPADGSKPMKQVEGFYADNGQPYKGQINLSRQNGNPGRVAGDKRPGAVNYIVGAEASPHGFTEFLSDNRWTKNLIHSDVNRYGTVQTFSLDLATLTPTPLSKAIDANNGRYTDPFTGNAGEVSRFGGDVACLDNGNFVVVIDDRSNMTAPLRTPTVAIIAPDGSVVKETFAVDPNNSDQIWANVAACQGGFALRFRGEIYFYDNAGTFKGKVDQATSGRTFDRGRGDGTRIAGHINSPYIVLAGSSAQVVSLAVFDSRDQKFVAARDVSEPGFAATTDRAGATMDALNRVVVVWESQPTGYEAPQTVARVLAFNSADKSVTPLTASFFPFVNVAKTGGIRTYRMNAAMTTKQILVAAKGEINLQNNPAQGKTSQSELNFYTVITHPDPKDDPTTPVGGAAPMLTIVRAGNNLTISWPAGAVGFTLESKNSLSDAAWTTVGTQNPTTVTIGAGNKFYRLRK
ncbi:MAG: hypothetical protein FJ387_07895 [Verrucomicrobia bacterium]|nr:hypothetical protein [Verrucomicrobiota bacterium]